MKLQKPFDTGYMNVLFKVGHELGKNGHHWAKFPPGYADPGAGPTLSLDGIDANGHQLAGVAK